MGISPPDSIVWWTLSLGISAFVAAAAAAVFAYLSWRQAQRATDSDISLRLLERCDTKELRDGESVVAWLNMHGHLASYKAFFDWLNANPRGADEAASAVRKVSAHYEFVGQVVRLTNRPQVTKQIVNYLMLACPAAFDKLKSLIADQRAKGSPSSLEEFEWLSTACSAAASRIAKE